MKLKNFLIGFMLTLILVLNSFAYARGGGGSRGGSSRSSSSRSSRSYVRPSKSSSSVVKVKSYRKKSGRSVAAHKRTKADKTKVNNFSTVGNVNPYTGKKGTKSP